MQQHLVWSFCVCDTREEPIPQSKSGAENDNGASMWTHFLFSPKVRIIIFICSTKVFKFPVIKTSTNKE